MKSTLPSKKKAPTHERWSPNVVCGIDLTQFSKHTQFIALSSGVLSFFITYGYVQVIKIPQYY